VNLAPTLRRSRAAIVELFQLPMNDLLFQAHTLHRQNFDPNAVQISTLLSIKTGGCPENCSYCPQSVHFDTGLKAEKLMSCADVVEKAKAAKAAGAMRFCMGAAWRGPTDKNVEKVSEMVKSVKALGLETCATLGMLAPEQAQALKSAGLDYYNHNLDTAPEYYQDIVSTRSYQDRLDTLSAVRASGMKVCCGGIVGMNETLEQRAGLLESLVNLPEPPESVPINLLVQVPGTPLNGAADLDPLEFVRTIAVARILLPTSYVRLSAGREAMSDELQAMCFFAGANSIFYGEKLLTTANPDAEKDRALFTRLGLHAMSAAPAVLAAA
jgi:biotin synthase